MSRRNQDKGRIEGPFVPMLVDTMASPAWKAMSPYARVVYYTLKSRYGHKIRNNGRIYLSARDGAEETGFDMKTVARSLRELRHYGFIVEMQTYCLGVLGKGKATHWRLTELGYMHEAPTRDFIKWDGEMFHEQKSPAYHKRQKRCLSKLKAGIKKQNPVPLHGTGCTTERHITVFQGAVQLPDEVFQGAAHTSQTDCATERHISRYNHSTVPDALVVPAADSAAGEPSGFVKPWLTLATAGLPVSDYWAWAWLSSLDCSPSLA
jgi:hypothetical protein